MADIGLGLHKLQILELVSNFLIESNETHIFANGKPTHKWYKGFMSRHPSIANRTASSLQSIRATCTQPETFDIWFQKG